MVPKMGAKQTLYDSFAEVAKAVAHGYRLQLLEHLAQGDRAVEHLANRTGITVANASQHLQHLYRAGLVTVRRAGTRRIYRLNSGVVELLASVRRASLRPITRGASRSSGRILRRATVWSR